MLDRVASTRWSSSLSLTYTTGAIICVTSRDIMMNLVFEQQLGGVPHTTIPGGLASAEMKQEAKGRVSVRALEVYSIAHMDSLISCRL